MPNRVSYDGPSINAIKSIHGLAENPLPNRLQAIRHCVIVKWTIDFAGFTTRQCQWTLFVRKSFLEKWPILARLVVLYGFETHHK
jgi:hypothetical protein